MKKYDAIIIGSGLGGLATAVILAKAGQKVAVFEKNAQLGGNLQTFSRQKHIFDTGVHYLGALSEGQNLYEYFRFLGISESLKLKKMDENGFDRISFDGDSNLYPHAQGYDNFVKQLLPYFPEERENLEKYISKIQEVCKAFPAYNLDLEGHYDEWVLYENTWEFICGITQNEKLRSVLAGNSFLYAGNKEKTPLYVHALIVNSYISSAYRCVLGGSQITKLLVKELRKYNADIFKHSEIANINIENQSITSIETQEGKEFTAEKFISNIDIKALLKILDGQQAFPKSFVSRINMLEPYSACFSVHAVLKNRKIPYFNYNIYHFKSENSVWKTDDYQKNNWPESYMLTCTESSADPGFAESITVLTYMNFDEVKIWENSINTVAHPNPRGEDYENFKEKKTKLLVEEVYRRFPEFQTAISSLHSSSPLTFRDYIGVQNGSMYGYEKDGSSPLKTMFSPKTKVSNLYLTGQSVNMHGILGVTVGAFNTCAEILGRSELNKMLNREKF